MARKAEIEKLPDELLLMMKACYAAGRIDTLLNGVERGEVELAGIFVESLKGQREWFAQIIDERTDRLAPHEQMYSRENVLDLLILPTGGE